MLPKARLDELAVIVRWFELEEEVATRAVNTRKSESVGTKIRSRGMKWGRDMTPSF